MSLLPGFVKAQSDNLPKIDSLSMFSFLGNNPNFMGAEIRGFKAQRSGRESYGDNAVGYVQVKRDGDICTVCAKVTPEHSIRKKAYSVTLQCNEKDDDIMSIQCDDCAASLGGCKHAIALLMWLHRRSEEPAVTSVSSYWKKSKLSCVGTSLKFIMAKDLSRRPDPLNSLNGSFREKVIEQSELFQRSDTVLTKYFTKTNKFVSLLLHNMFITFFKNKIGNTPEEFLLYASSQMSEQECIEAMKDTEEQSENSLWYHLRYGRITASKAYEAAHCKTKDGSLVEIILGASVIKDTAAMARGRRLEKIVCREVEKQKNIKIELCGFLTLPEYAVMGASPDGIADNFVVEVKCPTTEKSLKNYINNNTVAQKFYVQMQLQMLFFKKKHGLFCVAAPDFELSKNVTILTLDFDENLCKDIVEKCTSFWKTAVFPLIKENFD